MLRRYRWTLRQVSCLMNAEQDVYSMRFQVNLFQESIFCQIEKCNVGRSVNSTESMLDPIEVFQRGALTNPGETDPNKTLLNKRHPAAPSEDAPGISAKCPQVPSRGNLKGIRIRLN